MRFALAPAARLPGFRNYYPEYALHPGTSGARRGPAFAYAGSPSP